MFKQTRLLALLPCLFLTAGLAAQSLKPVPTYVLGKKHDISHTTNFAFFRKIAASDGSADRFAQYAQFLQMNRPGLRGLLAARPAVLALQLPYHDTELTVDLALFDITAPEFSAQPDESGQTVARFEGLHYRGMLRGAPNSVAAFSFFENEVIGCISDVRYHNLVLGRVQTADNPDAYMLYSDLNLAMDNPFECALLEPSATALQKEYPDSKPAEGNILRMALYAGYDLCLNRGGVPATTNYLMAMFNQLAVLFANEGIPLVLTRLTVLSQPVDRPFGTAVELEQFLPSEDHSAADIALFVGLAGENPESVAWVDGICTPQQAMAFCAIEPAFSNVPTFSWAAAVLAHETGHLLGARHPRQQDNVAGLTEPCANACDNTLMRYCLLASEPVAFHAGFGPFASQLLRERVRRAPCLQASGRAGIPEVKPGETPGQLTLTPNPARQQVTVQIWFSDGQMAASHIVVADLLGRPVLAQELQAGQTEIRLDLNNLAKGVYLLQAFDRDRLLATRRLIRE